MRFIIIHKTNAHWESGAIPDSALIRRVVQAASLQGAIDRATRQAEILGDVDKATPQAEADAEPSPQTRSRLAQLLDETTRSGMHLATETMTPSRKGRRYTNTAGGKAFYDGPFVESKELIGGYVIVSAGSLDEACRWVPSYMETIGADEVDVRELA